MSATRSKGNATPGLVAATVFGLMALGSVIAAFAGVIADPVQAGLRIHRRRLLRLLDALEAEIAGTRNKPFTAQEHVLAWVFGLQDTALTVLKAFRS
jgi:hypothetical protein